MDNSQKFNLWDTKFSRRQRNFYRIQDRTVIDELREDGTFIRDVPERPHIVLQELLDTSMIVDAFLKHGGSKHLDPPILFAFCYLREYLASASIRSLWDHPSHRVGNHTDLILLNDRGDVTGGPSTSRLWDSEEYLRNPPRGENVFARALQIPEFVSRLREKVRMLSIFSTFR